MNEIAASNSVLSGVAEGGAEITAADRLEYQDHSVQASDLRHRVAGWLLQGSHRIGAVALLATLGTWAMMYMQRGFDGPLAAAAGASDLGFCLALLGRMLVRHNAKLRREANGVAIFNLVLFILAVYFMVFARLPVIRADAAEFFTPTAMR